MTKKAIYTGSIFALFVLLIAPSRLDAQVFWIENFTNGCASNCGVAGYTGTNGAWSVTNTGTNGSDNNPWYVSSAEQGTAAGSCSSIMGTNECLHIGSNATVFGDTGATFLNTGLFGLYNILTDIRAESPTINCTGQSNITLSFNYIENGDGTNDNATLWYFDGTTWSQLVDLAKTTACTPTTSTWTTYSQLLPTTAGNNPNVRIGFQWVNNDDGAGDDPSIAIDDITLSVGVTATDSIITGAVTGPFCSCDSVDVPFTSTGLFTAGNVYTVELSDSTGSFASPVNIGSLASVANSGTISAQIPCTAGNGTNYLIRVTSSTPADTSSPVISALVINSVNVPSVTMSTSATTALCIDTAVTFTAVPVNGGTAPTYQWQLNGGNVGGNSPLFTTNGTFTMGDVITIIMVSNATCAVPDTVQDFMLVDCPQIEIPNVFTPNDDGINDFFRVNLSGRALSSFKIEIYDRWGLLIFSSTSINNKWDGRTTSGKKVVDGTYFYIVDLNGTVYKGHVTVL